MNSMRKRLVGSSLLCSAALLCGPAWAQDDGAVAEVVVTGSRIPTPNLTSVSPVTTVSAEEARIQGVTRVEDLINSLPQAFGDFGGNVSSGASGTANVNLRNLGNKRTLVLVNGRRLMPGDPDRVTAQAADINNIPAALVQRVEVVTGGASAVYGSDAVAGVVNFILQQDFQGVRLDAQHSFYQHENDSFVGRLLREKSYEEPGGNVVDGFATDVTVVLGGNFDGGRGNATLYAGYRNIEALSAAERDYSACALGSGAAFSCAGSTTTAPAQFRLNNPVTGATRATLSLDPATGNTFRTYVTARDGYNYGKDNYFQRPDERYTLGGFARYRFSEAAEAYAELMFMDDRSVAQVGPSGLFSRAYSINCDNPLLSAQQTQQMCTSVGLGPTANATVNIGRRNVEGGNRQNDVRHTAYRAVVGARGEITEAWDYDVYAQYGTTIYAQEYLNEFSLTRTQRALRAVRNPANGQIVCESVLTGVDPACVPYNVWQNGGVTEAALNYLETPGYSKGSTREQVVSGSLAGDLTGYGLVSPWATTGAGVALGVEYRRESLELDPDIAFRTGDLAGQGGAKLPVDGAFDVYEVFGELRVPIAEDQPFVKSLAVEAGYRFSDYSTAGAVDAYKLGGDWSPIEALRLRASYQRAVRAPNVVELYASRTNSLFGGSDPCAGAAPAATLAQCQNSGVSAAQYGTIPVSGAAQYNQIVGGNPDLQPESSDTWTYGLVFTPEFLPGFSMSLDYFDIKVEDLIGTVGANLSLSQCVTTGNPYFCSLITRSAGSGALFGDPAAAVVATNLNTGSLKTRGVDLQANYRFDLADVGLDYGALAANLIGTWTDRYVVEPLPGLGAYDCAGYFGNTCGGPIPEWRHKFRLTWQTPWSVDVSAAWRFVSDMALDTTSAAPLLAGAAPATDAKIRSYDFFDLALTARLPGKTVARIGVNNILDEDPPLIGTGGLGGTFGNGNTYPQTYDALGRYVFVGLTASF